MKDKLNLPIDAASSIFRRVSEVRLGLLRAFTTGAEGALPEWMLFI